MTLFNIEFMSLIFNLLFFLIQLIKSLRLTISKTQTFHLQIISFTFVSLWDFSHRTIYSTFFHPISCAIRLKHCFFINFPKFFIFTFLPAQSLIRKLFNRIIKIISIRFDLLLDKLLLFSILLFSILLFSMLSFGDLWA